MKTCANLIVVGAFCIQLGVSTGATAQDRSWNENEGAAPTIIVTSREMTDQAFKLSYEIRNNSQEDAWILAGTERRSVDADLFMADDGQTLVLRNRLDLPTDIYSNLFFGRYVRLRAGQTQAECISLPLPITPHHGLEGGRAPSGLTWATRLSIEISYYPGDLPGMIDTILEQREKIRDKPPRAYPIPPATHFADSLKSRLQFDEVNEDLTQRDDEVLIPYTVEPLKGARVLQTAVEGLHLPYEEKEEDRSKERHPPDLRSCTRIEITFQPSMLEYFYPYTGQQSLMSLEEIRSLKGTSALILEEPELLGGFAHDVSLGVWASGVVRQRSTAGVSCYRNGEALVRFPIHNDESIMVGKYRFMCFDGFPSLRRIMPIKPLDLRVRCASNLNHLWHRLHSCGQPDKPSSPGQTGRQKRTYPRAARWNDLLVEASTSDKPDKSLLRLFSCPSDPQAKCHYAMNPDCKWDSPSDTVLLFEGKAGWNQQGGPELFTFDNHNPRGGLVLLNDGTVKFIRTEEELKHLRWK